MTYNSISAVYQKLSQPVILRAFCLFLVLLIIWQLATGIESLLTFNKSISPQENQLVAIKATKKPMSSVGLTTPFFGEYVPDDIDVKESRLNLKVVGILFSSEDAHSFVILHTQGGGDQSFHVGDSVPGGALIKRITADGVLIERNGVLESLSLPKNELIFEPQPKPLVKD